MSINEPYFPGSIKKDPHSRLYRALGKRVFDVSLTILALPIVVPLIGILALLVALDGGKPFYRQDRIGKNGQVYRMWKLRSMIKDADICLERHLRSDPDLQRQWASKQKLVNDPRITKLGWLLRSSSADELPQLFNVLIGEMSLVGPRPMMVSQKDIYPGKDYCELLPGITGLWQVSARNRSTFVERADYDSHYNRTLSLANDLRILAATVKAVSRRTGC